MAEIFMARQLRNGYPLKTDPTDSCAFLPTPGDGLQFGMAQDIVAGQKTDQIVITICNFCM